MAAFRFEALDAAGKTITGLVDADNPKAARAQLRSQHLVPLKVDAVQVGAEASKQGMVLFAGRIFNPSDLAIWTRQLSGLVVAGLPLERALTALADEAEDPRQRELVAHLRSEVNAGAPFAQALSGSPKEFDDVYRGVVAAGEQSGQLGQVLEKLATDLEEQQQLKSKLIGATLYPAVVSVFAVVIVVALLVFVVPQVAQVFSSSKRALPMLTQFMLGLSAFMRGWGWLMALLLAAGGAGLAVALRNEDFRLKFDSAWLGLPLIGRLSRGYNAARFAGTLAMLAGSGVPILKALQAAAETLSNRAMRADALDALVQVREGAPLASALAAKKRFPGLLAMFARLGEQTGQLPVML
ncbi:MAG: type secretion system protein GspF, partial [Pseudomonadota bacterium]